jgi:hypothetical protein
MKFHYTQNHHEITRFCRNKKGLLVRRVYLGGSEENGLELVLLAVTQERLYIISSRSRMDLD